MKKLTAILLLGLVLSAHAGEAFRWRNVGADPCNPRSGCTLEWALAQSGWPAPVQAGLSDAVAHGVSTPYTMRSGWTGWMTWGQWQRKFHPNTVADWAPGHTEVADSWSIEAGGVRYNLYHVRRCQNWGGNISSPEPVPVVPEEPGQAPLGNIPTVNCPENPHQ